MNIIRKKLIQTLFFISLIFLLGGPLHAQEIPFPGLISFLQGQYASPFHVVGMVKEILNERLMFERGTTSLVKGQHLWVTDHTKGVTPQLQPQVAWIKVEAIYPKSGLASVEEIVGRGIEAGDWVMTSPVPLIHIYSNIKSKNAFPPYRTLLKSMVNKGFQVREVPGDEYPEKAGATDLMLRVEGGESGYLFCKLERLKGGMVLYAESLSDQGNIATTFPVGHAIRRTGLATGSRSAAYVSRPSTGTSTVSTIASPNFQVAKPTEKADLYRLSEPSFRVVKCDLEGNGAPELAFLQKNAVTVYALEKGQLIEKARYPFPNLQGKEVFPLHLHAMDLDGDGGDELFVTLSRADSVMDKEDNRICSQVLSFKGGAFRALAIGVPYYLRVITNRQGNRVPLAQSEGKYRQYSGPIYLIKWNQNAGTIEIGTPYGPAANIYSIYQFNLAPNDPQRVIILEPTAVMHGYFTPEEKVEASGEREYGSFREIAYPQKLEKEIYLGGFEKKTSEDVYAARRFELRVAFDSQSFVIYKERFGGVAQNLLKGKISSKAQGQDQVVGVKWVNNRIVETWQSKKLAKDVLDFTFLNDPARILVLYRDGDGYALEAFY